MKTVTINPQKCVGCRNCEMACAFTQSGNSCVRDYANIRVNVNAQERFVLPITCFHCEEAWCMGVCPANAISRNVITGAVEIDKTRCAGCKMCILSCPYGNIHFDHINLVSHKCDLCGGDPECVKHCIGMALNYEEIDDFVDKKSKSINQKISRLLKQH